MNYGEYIKYLRKEHFMTQRELGELIGVSQQQIAQWENGIKNPKRETIEKIGNAIFLTNQEFKFDLAFWEHSMIENETMGQQTIKKERENNKNIKENQLINNFHKLNDAGKDKAIEHVEILAKIPEYRLTSESTIEEEKNRTINRRTEED